MVKHNLENTGELIAELALEIYLLKTENATLHTLLVKNETINSDEYKQVYNELLKKGKSEFMSKLLKITEDEATGSLNGKN